MSFESKNLNKKNDYFSSGMMSPKLEMAYLFILDRGMHLRGLPLICFTCLLKCPIPIGPVNCLIVLFNIQFCGFYPTIQHC